MQTQQPVRDLGVVGVPSMRHATQLFAVIVVGGVLLFAGFGDGIGFAFTTLTGQRSPWILLLPILLVPLGAYLVARGPRALDRVDKLLVGAFALFSVLVFVVESWIVPDFYVAGLLQLLVFVLVVILVCGVFAAAPEWLNVAFRRSLPIVHYFLSGYIVFSYIAWHLFRWDPSIRVILTSAAPRVVDYYGFRPSGFSAEPQWAAIALAASYTGIHCLLPRQRLNAFIALCIGAEALQSGTAYLFVAAVVALYASQRVRALAGRERLVLLVGAVLTIGLAITVLTGNIDRTIAATGISLSVAVVLAVVVQIYEVGRLRGGRRTRGEVLFTAILLSLGLAVAALGVAPQPTPVVPSPTPQAAVTSRPTPVSTVAEAPLDRAKNFLTGRDPSTAMRATSAVVAWRVIEQSFPVGVGYGNFRDFAAYPPEFIALLPNFRELDSYKSDFFVLNYVAELGILGAILVIWFAGVLIRTRHALTIAFVGLIAALSGTLLLPPALALAAVVGLLVRDKREHVTEQRA